jgi:hypothetical protein
VTKLDRLARSVGDLLGNVARLEAKNVWLRVLAGNLAVAFPQQSISNPRSAFLFKSSTRPSHSPSQA